MIDMEQWYLVYTKPRKEEDAATHLTRQGYQVYLPRLVTNKRLRGHWQQVQEPLFPRYLFIKTDSDSHSLAPVRSTYGVSRLVRFGAYPLGVSEEFISQLRQTEQAQNRAALNQGVFRKADRVAIVRGPLSGLQAIFEMNDGESRAVVLLDLLGKQNRMNLDLNDLAPVA